MFNTVNTHASEYATPTWLLLVSVVDNKECRFGAQRASVGKTPGVGTGKSGRELCRQELHTCKYGNKCESKVNGCSPQLAH